MSQRMRLEKFDDRIIVRFGNKILFQGEVIQAKAEPFIRDVHGHCRIKERFSQKENLPPGRINLVSEEPFILEINGSESNNRLIVIIGAFSDERVLGGGEQYTQLDLKGKKFPIYVQEQGIGRGWSAVSLLAALKGVRGSWYTTYFPQPVFFSSVGYGVVVDTNATVVADFRKKERTVLEIWDNKCKLIFLEGSLEEMVKKFHLLYSTKPIVQDWVFGVWLASQGGIAAADRAIAIARKWNIPVTALWCQDWSGKKLTKFGRQVYWNWEYDKTDYANLPYHIQRWKEEGIHFLGYINPFLIKGGKFYQQARQKGFLVRRPNGEVYDVVVTTFPAGMIDLSNPEACHWYKEIIKQNMIAIGMAGWMADFGEYLPTDARLASATGLQYHNQYVLDWAKLNAEAVKESTSDAIFFMRAGYLGTTKYVPIYWAGDQNVDWSKSDGLPSVIPAMLSTGICGVKLFHFDIGGYTSMWWLKRTPELFMRWTEAAAFSPIMRTHQTNRPDRNIQFYASTEILMHFSIMSQMHYELREYLQHQLNQSFAHDLPLVRHLAIHYPEDDVAWDIKYEYLLGRDLLVAPVIKPKITKWTVYLPNDRWIHLWSKKEFKKGWVKVEAPIGQPPVFIREESNFANKLIELATMVSKNRKFQI